MQYLKDEVRQRILNAASEEFFVEGYADASIRVIAKNAGISSGNVYRYFSSKSLIFDEIVGPVYAVFLSQLKAIEEQMEQIDTLDPNLSMSCIKSLDGTLLKLFEENRRVMSMLLFKSQGSNYEHIRQELHRVTTNALLSVFPFDKLNFSQTDKALWAKSVATGLIESTCYLLANSNDETPVASLLTEYITMHSKGMHAYFAQ